MLIEALQWFLFLVLVFVVSPHWGPVVGAGILLAHLCRAGIRPIIAILNLLAGCLTLSLALQGVPTLRQLAISAGSYLAMLGASVFYLFATLRVPRHFVAIFWALVVGFACFHHSGLSPVARGILILLTLGLWHNGFYFTQVRSPGDFNWLDFLICQRPFFLSFLTPTPPLLSQLLAPAPAVERSRVRWNALALLAFTALCNWASNRLLSGGETSVILSVLRPGGFSAHSHELATLFSRWGAVILMSLLQLMVVIQAMGLSIAACQMLGIRLRNPVGNVFASRTVFEFFERSNRYYAILILDLFIYPIIRQLHAMRSRTLREFISFFAGIFVGGMVQHFFRLFLNDVVQGIREPLLTRLLGASAYWALIALAVSCSVLFERTRKAKARPQKFPYVRGLLYFVLGAVLYVFVKDYEVAGFTFSERLRFALSLFVP